MLLLIDNYDSFTFNLAHYFEEVGVEVKVVRNDEINIQQIEALAPSHICISPGPCTPNEAGISVDVIKHFAGKMPILGVCLGHQCIAQAFGGKIIKAPKAMHGKTALIEHKGKGLFSEISRDFLVTRYHSLVVETKSLPENLTATAWCYEGVEKILMALESQTQGLYGVQFHPESIMSEFGHKILANFINIKLD